MHPLCFIFLFLSVGSIVGNNVTDTDDYRFLSRYHATEDLLSSANSTRYEIAHNLRLLHQSLDGESFSFRVLYRRNLMDLVTRFLMRFGEYAKSDLDFPGIENISIPFNSNSIFSQSDRIDVNCPAQMSNFWIHFFYLATFSAALLVYRFYKRYNSYGSYVLPPMVVSAPPIDMADPTLISLDQEVNDSVLAKV